MSDCSLEIGTGCLLDLLGQAAGVHVALGTELARDREHLIEGRHGLNLANIPKGPAAELCKRAAV